MIQEAIDEALSIVGEKSKNSIYYYLESEHGLTKEKIPCDLRRFHEALRALFGVGAFALEKHIRSCLEKKFGVYIPNSKGLEFIEFIIELKQLSKE